MAFVSLLLDRGPLAGPPFNLLFGDDGEIVVADAALDVALPGPTFAAAAVPAHDTALAVVLPLPSFVALATPAHDSALVAALPGPTFAAAALVLSDIVYPAELAAALPGPTFDGLAVPAYGGALAAVLPGPTFAAAAVYDLNVSRPTVGQTAPAWQGARHSVQGPAQRSTGGDKTLAGAAPAWTAADRTAAWIEARKPRALAAARVGGQHRHADAAPLHLSALARHAELQRARTSHVGQYQEALARRASAASAHQDRLRDRRPALSSSFSQALQLRRVQLSSHQTALPFRQVRPGRHQDAMRPPAGYGYQLPIPPQPDPCYTPSGHLLFADKPGGTALLFICDNHDTPGPGTVVVPIREVYMVTNNVSLIRLVDGQPVPVLSASLSLDVDSWAWGFSASLPGAALALVEPGADGPVELLASINGTVFHVLAEQVGRDRSFGQSSIRISGRGRNAVLDAPYAPIQTFTNPGLRTSQQLMDDVLTLNGVSLGWGVDWGLEAWNVPTGVFSHQGSYVSALLAIAQAGGGYLLPHADAKSFKVQPRYPVAPWEWGSVTPDFVLPSAVVTRESMAWKEKPVYNRVYVSGQAQGVLGRVTRAGTAGDSLAPMVVDQLITTAAAARQRGLPILADTGRQVEVGLRLPVLAETGIIRPGAFVQYQDGPETRLGLVRSVGIEAGFPDVWQTLGVETHA